MSESNRIIEDGKKAATYRKKVAAGRMMDRRIIDSFDLKLIQAFTVLKINKLTVKSKINT
jgi:fatty acid-binding protein DegV